jgi:hypothetical protein
MVSVAMPLAHSDTEKRVAIPKIRCQPGDSTMSMWNVLFTLAASVLCAGSLALGADNSTKADDGPVYELRTYTANEGKMADLHKRFRDHTMQIFEKHGMKNIGYWVPVDKPDTLVYIIEHKSQGAAKESWKAFRADPEWRQVSKESEKNGRLVKEVKSVYMKATDYSPMK